MKKATITVNFDEEKTAALKLYLEQKPFTPERWRKQDGSFSLRLTEPDMTVRLPNA